MFNVLLVASIILVLVIIHHITDIRIFDKNRERREALKKLFCERCAKHNNCIGCYIKEKIDE